MTTHSTDICIIGAGSGGLSLAAGAAQMGASVTLIERGKMGGDCLNYGCAPSKALLASGKVARTFREAQKFGITSQEPNIDFKAVHDHVHDIMAQIEPNDSQNRFENLGVYVIREEASFIDKHTLQAGNKLIKAKYIVVATGSSAFIPPLPGLSKQFRNVLFWQFRNVRFRGAVIHKSIAHSQPLTARDIWSCGPCG